MHSMAVELTRDWQARHYHYREHHGIKHFKRLTMATQGTHGL